MPGRAQSRLGAGGGNRVRTGDVLLAKQVLSQLSYAPAQAFRRFGVPAALPGCAV